LTLFEVEDSLHLGKTQIKFGFSLDLHYLCKQISENGLHLGHLSELYGSRFAPSLHRDSEKSYP
jgi:hypothetical protein